MRQRTPSETSGLPASSRQATRSGQPAGTAARSQGGSIVVYLVVGLAAFGVLAMAGATRFGSVVTSVFSPNCATSARYMAESGMRYAMARLRACNDIACVTAAIGAMDGKTVSVDAAKGLEFRLAANYNAADRTASVTSTGTGCKNISAVDKSLGATINLPVIAGTGDIDFSNLSEDFTISPLTGTKIPITVDSENRLVFMGVIGDTYNSGAIWFTSNNTYCVDGVCNMNYGLRAYFEPQWDTDSVADGLVFAVKNAANNALLSAGGDPYKDMGEVMGWAGPGPKSLGTKGISAPKLGLELDTWRNDANTDVTSADSRADYDYDLGTENENRNSDHMSFVFWGGENDEYISTGRNTGFYTPTYDDNRHARTFDDTDAGSGTNTQPKSYIDLDKRGDGRWGYYYKSANSVWLRDGTKHLIRFELSRLPSYPNAAGNYPYLLKAWARTGTPTAAYKDVRVDYTADTPDLYRAIFLSPTMHTQLAKVIVGMTEATGAKTQRVRVSGLNVSFKQTQDVPAMPRDYVAYFPMSEGSGSTAADSNGTTATLYNGASWVTGCTKCPAVNFDGTNDAMRAANSPATAPSTRGSITAWYSIPNMPGSSAGWVHKGDSTSDTDEAYSLQMTATGRLGLIVRQNNTTALSVNTTITAGSTWRHVAATWDEKELLIYIDGELKGRTANTNAVYARASSGGLTIGAQNYNTGTGSTYRPFRGRLSRVAIYNRTLTAVEVASMAVAP